MSLILDAGLTFEEEAHAYHFEGRRVPGVTSLLDGLHSFAGVPREILEAAKCRGTFVHRMCELDDLGDLVEDEDIEPYLGYLRAWRSFRADYEPNWAGIEERGYSRRFRYAGTMDRRGTFGRTKPGLRVIADIKTSEDDYWIWGVQVAAYRQLLVEHDMSWALARRYTIQLRKTGKYELLPWDDPADWETFAALLHLHHRQEAVNEPSYQYRRRHA